MAFPFSASVDFLLAYIPDPQTLGIAGYVLVFILVFMESFVFTGMVTPGAAFAVMLGALSAHGWYNIWVLIALSSVASYLGDIVSYEIGHRNAHLADRWPKLKSGLPRAQKFFATFGHFGIIFGRFFGWTRPLVPFVAGVVRYPRPAFYPICGVSCVLWAAAYIGTGYAFGEAWRVALKWSAWALLAVAALALLVWGAFWLWRYWMVLGTARLKTVLKEEKKAATELLLDKKIAHPTPLKKELDRVETPSPPSWS